jgi:hypothetical protein
VQHIRPDRPPSTFLMVDVVSMFEQPQGTKKQTRISLIMSIRA